MSHDPKFMFLLLSDPVAGTQKVVIQQVGTPDAACVEFKRPLSADDVRASLLALLESFERAFVQGPTTADDRLQCVKLAMVSVGALEKIKDAIAEVEATG
jgi:hypothetical protein